MNSGLAQVCHSTASTSKEIRFRPSSSRTASRSFAAATMASTGASSPGARGLEGVEPLAQRAVLGDAAELVPVERRPALDQAAGERAGLPGELAVGVRVHAADLGHPRVVVREEVLAVLAGTSQAFRGGRCRRPGCASDAEALDLDLDDVAGLQQPRRRAGVADAGRRAGGQQVARAQGEGVRDQREGVADGVDHLVGAPVLDDLAVDPGLHPQPVAQVAHLGGRAPSARAGRSCRRSCRGSTG